MQSHFYMKNHKSFLLSFLLHLTISSSTSNTHGAIKISSFLFIANHFSDSLKKINFHLLNSKYTAYSTDEENFLWFFIVLNFLSAYSWLFMKNNKYNRSSSSSIFFKFYACMYDFMMGATWWRLDELDGWRNKLWQWKRHAMLKLL